MIASARPGTSIHTKEFAQESIGPLSDQAVIDGAKAMAMTAIDYWTSSKAQHAVREEFVQANTDKDVL
jgi:hypothetical protein